MYLCGARGIQRFVELPPPGRIANLPKALELYPTLTPRMSYWLRHSDPIADALVDATSRWEPGRLFREVEHAVCQGDDSAAPSELHPLLEQAGTIPAWVDFERVDRGGAFFLSTHLVGGLVLGARSLILGYAAPAGNKPLVMSGRLERGVNRRLAETSRFVVDVTRPGNLTPGGAGVASALKVRLIHAKVRRMIARVGEWDEEWGSPINQHDMMGTVILFSLVLLQGLEKLGLHPTAQESEDYIALWRYVGYLLGVEQELLPATRAEAERTQGFIDLTQAAPDDDARRLTRAFLDASASDDPGTSPGTAIGHVLARELLGDELADALDIDSSRLRLALPFVRATVGRLNTLRRRPAGRPAAARAGARYWAWVLANNPAGPVDLTMPESLLRASLRAA